MPNLATTLLQAFINARALRWTNVNANANNIHIERAFKFDILRIRTITEGFRQSFLPMRVASLNPANIRIVRSSHWSRNAIIQFRSPASRLPIGQIPIVEEDNVRLKEQMEEERARRHLRLPRGLNFIRVGKTTEYRFAWLSPSFIEIR